MSKVPRSESKLSKKSTKFFSKLKPLIETRRKRGSFIKLNSKTARGHTLARPNNTPLTFFELIIKNRVHIY